jgi:succinate-acetate transporter protein
MLEQKAYEQRENALREIDAIRFPIFNIRRTSNLAVAPVNTFGLAMGLFMLSLPLMNWCEFRSPTLATALMFGGLCQYIIGIYDWYQGKTLLCFIDFIFGLLHLLIYYSFKLCEYDITPVSEKFESYLIGTFFVLYLVVLLALVLACKDRGIIHIINLILLIVADVLVLSWQYIYKKGDSNRNYPRVKKTAGYFLFFASLTIWFTGMGKLINDIFQRELIPTILPDL